MLRKWFKCVSLVLLITGVSFDFASAATKSEASSSAKSTKKQLNSQIKKLKQNSEVKEYLGLVKKYKKATKKNAQDPSQTEQMKSRIAELEGNSDVKKLKELQEQVKQINQENSGNKDKTDQKKSSKKNKKAKKNKKKKTQEVSEDTTVADSQSSEIKEEKKKNKKKTKKAKKKTKKNKVENEDWRNEIAVNTAEVPATIEPTIEGGTFEKSTLQVEKDVGQHPVKEIETPTLVAGASNATNNSVIEPPKKLFDENIVFVPLSSEKATDEEVKRKIADISRDLENYHLVKNVNKQVKNSTTLGMELRKDLERYRQTFTNEKLTNS